MQIPYSNLQISHQNPEASKPLILPVQVICNTSDEQLFNNILVNSRRPGKWVKLEESHDKVAVLCGSGPSLADNLDEIRALQTYGALIFAMNGAAVFLAENNIMPDYQVMIDARPETADLVGPAGVHLFGSQVHPKSFDKVLDIYPSKPAVVWHLQITDIDSVLPEYNDDYCLIGGAASVGNCATCLAYSMGYRTLEIFGYDSSHRDNRGHAFSQPLNNGDPCAWVTVHGKDFKTSLTMKLQAEKFMATSRALKELGVSIRVHGEGLLPTLYNSPLMDELEKYTMMWAQPCYREVAPGEHCVETFLEVAKPHGEVIDFGCGTGRAGLALADAGLELQVLLVDFTSNSRDSLALELPFYQADLSHPMNIRGNFGFCTDVLEHIPPDQVDSVILNIMACVPRCFFQISLVDDVLGGLIGQPLHLSVHPFQWWLDKFTQLGYSVGWSKDQGDTAMFYMTKF